jgi:hypothetical protein
MLAFGVLEDHGIGEVNARTSSYVSANDWPDTRRGGH